MFSSRAVLQILGLFAAAAVSPLAIAGETQQLLQVRLNCTDFTGQLASVCQQFEKSTIRLSLDADHSISAFQLKMGGDSTELPFRDFAANGYRKKVFFKTAMEIRSQSITPNHGGVIKIRFLANATSLLSDGMNEVSFRLTQDASGKWILKSLDDGTEFKSIILYGNDANAGTGGPKKIIGIGPYQLLPQYLPDDADLTGISERIRRPVSVSENVGKSSGFAHAAESGAPDLSNGNAN